MGSRSSLPGTPGSGCSYCSCRGSARTCVSRVRGVALTVVFGAAGRTGCSGARSAVIGPRAFVS